MIKFSRESYGINVGREAMREEEPTACLDLKARTAAMDLPSGKLRQEPLDATPQKASFGDWSVYA